MSELNKVKLIDNAEYDLKDDTGTLSSHLHHDEDLVPLVSKTYASNSYYATSNDYANASWYFMSVKPNAWYQPWTVRLKVRTKCPNQVNWYSYTWATISGRTDGVIYANWNEQSTTAHTYITFYPLKQAGFNAGYGHAIGISIYNGNAPTTANNYRTFEIDYYSCDNCTVDILDTPVKWESWTGTGTTNYGSLSSFNANSRGLQESGDANDIDAIYVYFGAKTGAQGIWAGSLFMQDGNKTYQNICTASDGTATNANRTTATTKLANANGFLVGGTIYYSSANYNANTNISGWGSARSRVGNVFDARYSFNVTLTANSLTPYAPVYLVGTINSTDGLFYLDQVWWTQTPNATDKIYVLVGGVYDSTTSNCRMVLYEDNPWYKYDGSKLVELTNGHIVNKDVPSDAVFTDHTYSGTGLISVNSSGVISTTAEANQNAFSNIKVGSTTIAADSKTDTFELIAGTNITLTPDATNDTITIDATGGGSSTDEKVKQSPSTANADLRVLLSKSANDDEETDFVRKSSALKYNPSTGNLKTTQLNGVNVGSSPIFTDEKVTQTECASDDANYRVILSGSFNSTTKTEGVKKCDHFICNPNNADVSIVSGKTTTRTIIQNTTTSANDFAEARLELGNSKDTTAAKSSFGNLRIFDQSQYYTNIYHNVRLTGNRSLRLPNQTGTIAITDDIKNATLTIKQNNTSKGTFTSNASSNATIDLTDNQVRMFPVPSNADGYYWFALCDNTSSDHVGQLVYKSAFQVNTSDSRLLINDNDGYLQVGDTITGPHGKYGNLRVDLGVAYMRSTQAGQNLVIASSGENDYRIKLGVWANGSGGANSWMFAPTANGKLLLGAANCRWGQIYSTSSSISTSDRREKKDITPLDEKAKELIMALNPVSYKFIDGNSGRTHYGMIAQDVEEEMTEIGLTPMDVAAFCKDQKTVSYVDSNGDEKDMPVQGEYVYGLRYEEFIAPMIKTIQMQQQEIDELKSELAEIKALLLNR